MNLAELTANSLGTLLFYTIGIAVVVLIFSMIIFWFFNARGWMNITASGPRWYKVIAGLGAVLVAMIIGGGIGFQIGVVNVAGNVIDQAGPALLNEGLTSVLPTLGIASVDEEISLDRIRLVLKSIKDARLEKATGLSAVALNNALETTKKLFLPRAEELINTYSPDYKLSVANLTANSWKEVSTDVKTFNTRFMTAHMLSAAVFVIGFGCASLLFSWLLRSFAGKAKPA